MVRGELPGDCVALAELVDEFSCDRGPFRGKDASAGCSLRTGSGGKGAHPLRVGLDRILGSSAAAVSVAEEAVLAIVAEFFGSDDVEVVVADADGLAAQLAQARDRLA